MRHYDASEFDKGNQRAAEIVLAGDPQTFGPGLVEWARAWQAAHPPRVQRWERPPIKAQESDAQLALFAKAGEQAEGQR